MIKFSELGLSGQVLRAVEKCGYDTPTPIQEAAIPPALAGKDLTGCAQTGTGKTAAFVLPMISRLHSSETHPKDNDEDRGRRDDNRRNGYRGGRSRGPSRPVRALVVTPTRELALQVAESVRTYGVGTGIRSVAVYGGVAMGPQIDAFRRGVDIVIATPGRLLDHTNRRNLDLSKVEILVLDEADRMFDMGFINDVRKIVSETSDDRQTLLFSATMAPPIEKLAREIQRNPEMIEIGLRTNAAELVEQKICGVHGDAKIDLLLHVLRNEPAGRTVVFTRTKHRADKIARKLIQSKISAVAIHSNRSQAQRRKGLADFTSGRFQVLVATDVAARGLDVNNITHVINFDIPGTPEDYIHRIGRTGRAGVSGEAWTFISPEDRGGLASIERMIGRQIDRVEVEGVTHEIAAVSNRSGRSDRPFRGGGQGGRRNGSGRSGGGSGSGRSGSSRGGSSRNGYRSSSESGGTSRPKRRSVKG
jgi:ATP-dependent RNA helicase RhlE